MNLYCITCLMFTKNRDSKIKREIDGKIKLAFNVTWLMEILRIYQEEQLLIKYYVIKCLILLKIQNMMDINKDGLNGL